MIEQVLSCSPWGDCAEEDIHTAWRTLHWSMWIFPKLFVVHGEPILEQVFTEWLQPMERPTLEKRKRMEQQKGTDMDWLWPHHSSSSCTTWNKEKLEKLRMKKWSWAWEKWGREGRCCFNLQTLFIFCLSEQRLVRGVKRGSGWVGISHLAKFKPP